MDGDAKLARLLEHPLSGAAAAALRTRAAPHRIAALDAYLPVMAGRAPV